MNEVVMKLAKKNGRAVLSIEITGTGSGGGILGRGGHVLVAHDVLIDVLRPNDLDKLKEPMCPPADVSALLYVLSPESIPHYPLRVIFGNMFSAFRLYLLFTTQCALPTTSPENIHNGLPPITTVLNHHAPPLPTQITINYHPTTDEHQAQAQGTPLTSCPIPHTRT